MSTNLVDLIRRHHSVDAPTAVEMLSARMAESGELSDDDIRAVAADAELPEAAVHGIATFYDDLLAPRGATHVRACTGTACFAATGGGHMDELAAGLGVRPGERSADGAVSFAETVCLGFCHSSPAVRVERRGQLSSFTDERGELTPSFRDVVDAGPGVVARVLEGVPVAAVEPESRSLLHTPVLTKPGDYSGVKRALAEMTPEELLAVVKAAELRGRGGAGFPAGNKWEFASNAEGEEKFIVANGDEGDPGSYIDKLLMERSPALLVEGMALAGYAVGARHGFVLVRSEYPLSKPAIEAAVAAARAEGLLGERFDVTVVEGAGSYVVGEETALLACLQGLRGTVSARPPFPAQKGMLGMPTVVNNVETLCNVGFIASHGAEAYRALSPDTETAGSKLVCFNERFANPGMVEVPFGMTCRELCEEVAGGLRDGRSIKALQIGGPLGGILPASLLDTPFDFEPLAAVGCMVGHGSILAFDDRTDMRDVATHLLGFGAHESCGKCFPCRIGLKRAFEEFSAGAAIDRANLEALLETLEVASLCAHGGGMPAPIRSLLAHFPEELRVI